MDSVTPIGLGLPAGGAEAGHTRSVAQVVFDRRELTLILDVYGRMVAAGLWRDYAIGFERAQATFSAFERAAERPDVMLIKRPEWARRQGQYALIGRAGQVLKRGHELRPVLGVVERKLIKLVEG
jgi:hypothetical protein